VSTQLPPSPTLGESFNLQPLANGGDRRGRPERRRGKRPILLAAIFSLAAGSVAGAFLGARHEENHWRPLYKSAVDQVAHWKADSTKWQQDSDEYQGQLHGLQDQVSSTVGNLNNPHFVLWNSCGSGGPDEGCSLTPGYEYVGGVPDTFTYNLDFQATVPVTVRIMSTHDYVCWKAGYCAAHWVWWQDRTNVTGAVFHDAEGCAGYLAVFSSDEAGILYPDVSITRNPAPTATGACA
jgi:hypothetical protein